jgi:three-Cys-motif partner protein
MVKKPYAWPDGATLEDHSRRKHKILREYFFNYLIVRCQLPQQERFRLAVIDGFAGGGRYSCGTAGSPIIFIEELKRGTEAVNLQRAAQGLGAIEIECLLVLNDASRDVIELLKTHVAPLHGEITQNVAKLYLRVEYLNEPFEAAYPTIKQFLQQGRYRNVLFNLDQCGHPTRYLEDFTNMRMTKKRLEFLLEILGYLGEHLSGVAFRPKELEVSGCDQTSS